MIAVLLVCVSIYLLWGLINGVVNAKAQKTPWWSALIVMIFWFPVAMGLKIKIGPVKLRRGDE